MLQVCRFVFVLYCSSKAQTCIPLVAIQKCHRFPNWVKKNPLGIYALSLSCPCPQCPNILAHTISILVATFVHDDAWLLHSLHCQPTLILSHICSEGLLWVTPSFLKFPDTQDKHRHWIRSTAGFLASRSQIGLWKYLTVRKQRSLNSHQLIRLVCEKEEGWHCNTQFLFWNQWMFLERVHWRLKGA